MLISKFLACEQYLTKVLYPYKSSWAHYAINHRLNRSLYLTNIVGKIQRIFDQQSKKAILTECKNEISIRGIPLIIEKYFPKLDKILREYLTPQILQKQYDWLLLLEILDDYYQQEMVREDNYDQPQSLFSSLIKKIPHNSIWQVWKLINRGIVCRHFFQVMSYSIYAQFHISLISRRWYNYNKYNIEQHKELIFQIEENELEGPQLSFQHLANFRQTLNVIQPQDLKQKYGFCMGYTKKILDLAIRADKVNEFVNQIKYFIKNIKSMDNYVKEKGGRITRLGKRYYKEFLSIFWKKPVSDYIKIHKENVTGVDEENEEDEEDYGMEQEM
ncbi:hypothetical protein C1645_837337 [Glomus cerebriforme]|uniref:Uncharacterized protein n=1 Tax=Glomus cerebriforme TaxID=658196 RepID=A0A397SA91_9GLOM|nr:hypothetical protein C1645_837337 [Glomus cerebriforme]